MRRRSIWVLTLLLFAGCEERPRDVLREFPPPRPADVPARSDGPIRFQLAHDGSARFSVRFGKRSLRGNLALTSGQLSLDPLRLGDARGSVEFDLRDTTFEAVSVGVGQDPPAQSLEKLGLAALELDRPTPDHVRRGRFQLLKVYTEDDEQRVRRPRDAESSTSIDVRARGLLELHGFRTEQVVKGKLVFEFDDASADAPVKVRFKTQKAHPLDISRHGILPRRPAAADAAEEPSIKLGALAGLHLDIPFTLAQRAALP